MGSTIPFLGAALFLLWIAYVAYHGFTSDLQFLRQAAIGARHTFGIAGALLTAYGLISYSREIRPISRSGAKMLRAAGITFLLYAVFAGVISSGFTLIQFPLPVEVLRGLSAVMIAYFIIRALNIFDIETRMKFERQTQLMIQSEKLTSLGQLAAGIAHEINNPLTNASLGIQTLKQRIGSGRADPATLDRLEMIEQSIDRAAGITQELLQFSRQQAVRFLPVNINTIIRGALTLLKFKLKHVTVREELLPVPDIMGDAGKLEQVMINVLSNAVEAMPDGGIIGIKTRLDGHDVQVRVEDNGCGISREHLKRVFDPFFTTKEIGQGTGLGLSICYGIVKQHDGTIEVASEANKGTTMTMRFPARRTDDTGTDR